jgi:hypothetical protein
MRKTEFCRSDFVTDAHLGVGGQTAAHFGLRTPNANT